MELSSNWKVLGLALVVASAIGCGTSTIPSNGGTSEKAKEESPAPTGTAELSERSDSAEVAKAAEAPEKKEDAKPTGQADSAKSEEPAKKDAPSAEPPRNAQRGNPPADRPGGQPQDGAGRGRSGFGGGLAFLVGSEAVRKELNLTDDQIKKIQAAMPQRPAQGQGDSGLSREEMQAEFAEAQKKIEALLTPAQKTRVKELQYQMMGLRAFTNDAVVKELALSEDQVEKIRGLLPQRRQGGPGAGQNVTPEERQKQRAAATKKALEILKPDQRAKWEKMIGKPFVFPAPSRGTTGRPGGSAPGSGGVDRDA